MDGRAGLMGLLKVFALAGSFLSAGSAIAQPVADPRLASQLAPFAVRSAEGLHPRFRKLDPKARNLILITMGQSLRANQLPTLYLPHNPDAIESLNIYDCQRYAVAGPLPGTDIYRGVRTNGAGNIAVILADLFEKADIFDRIVIVPIAVGGTRYWQWDKTGPLQRRFRFAMDCLAAQGIKPNSPGLTWAVEIGIGEADSQARTSQARLTRSLKGIIADVFASGFPGRVFVARESYDMGRTSRAVTGAQTAVIDGKRVFLSGDLDTLRGPVNRQMDGVHSHLTDTGGHRAAHLIFRAMRASGRPF